MKKALLLFAAALTIAGCKAESLASDGYYFERDRAQYHERKIEVIMVANQAQLYAEYRKYTNKEPDGELMAFSRLNNDTCVVYVLDPKISYKPEFIGHELTHCLYSEFHPSQNNRSR